MKTTLGFLGTLLLVLSLAACACPAPGSDGCKMCAGMAKGDEKAMKCDMKAKPGGCCDKKEGAPAKPGEGHQH